MFAATCLLKSLLGGAKSKTKPAETCCKKSSDQPENTKSTDAIVQAHVDAVHKR